MTGVNASMAKKYGKPSLTNMEPELGRRIFNIILSTPKPDHEKMKMEADAGLRVITAKIERDEKRRARHAK